MKLMYIEIQGFKGFRNWFSELDDDSFATLSCSTSTDVTEAIIWCLKGCDRRGETRGIRRRLLHPEHKLIRVKTTWMLSDQQNEVIEIVRELAVRQKTLLMNQRPIIQDDIDSLIQSIDLQLAILSPLYFTSLSIPKYQDALSNLLFQITPNPFQTEDTTVHESSGSSLTLDSISTQLDVLRDYVNESKAYVKDEKIQMTKAKLTSCLSDALPSLNNEKNELIQKIKELMNEEGPQRPDILKEWKDELKSLGTLYHSRVDQWKSLKSAGSVEQLDGIKKHCESLIHDGKILKSQIEKEEAFWETQLVEFEKDKSYQLQLLQQDLNRVDTALKLSKNATRRESTHQLNYEQGIVALEEAKHELRVLSKSRLDYVRQQVDEANKHLNNAKITLNHRWSNGELKMKLDLTYREKPLYDLLPDEQVQCSLELTMFMLLTNRTVIETHEFINSTNDKSYDQVDLKKYKII